MLLLTGKLYLEIYKIIKMDSILFSDIEKTWKSSQILFQMFSLEFLGI